MAENYIAKFQKMFLDVLDKGDFVELDQSIISNSYGSAGFLGTGMAVRASGLERSPALLTACEMSQLVSCQIVPAPKPPCKA